MEVTSFSVWDYVVFGLVLLVSAGIGVYHAARARLSRAQNTTDFLMAGRSMSALPVALSVLASFFSSSTLLGTPAEVYLRGALYWLSVVGACAAPLVGLYLFGPLFHRLRVVSIYEYLEMRYRSRAVRLFGAGLFIIRATLGMGIVLFGPSVALNAVTGFPVWAAILTVGVIATFYTALGGMKAVIWTDVFQLGIMLAGMLAAIIQGSIEVGGLKEVWDISDRGGRFNKVDFDPDPRVRHTFWTLVVGNLFVWLMPYSVDQQMVQRFASTRTLKDAQIMLLLNAPGMLIIISLCCLAGLVMYAYYAACDPLLRGTITDSNQLLPRFVLDVLGFAPGLPGLFTAALFSGALSSISSMLNSLSAVTWEDFLKRHFRNIPERKALLATKLLSVAYGVVAIGMAFVFSTVGGTVLQMSLTFNGSAGGPLVGIFILGTFFPWVNSWGAMVGGVLGFAFPMWISIGAYVTKPPVTRDLPRNVSGCPDLNSTGLGVPTHDQPLEGITQLYAVSYLWMSALGILTTVTTGLVVSLLTGNNCSVHHCTGRRHVSEVDPQLMVSYPDKLWCCLPESAKRWMRCGISFTQPQDAQDETETVKNKQVENVNHAYIPDLEEKPPDTRSTLQINGKPADQDTQSLNCSIDNCVQTRENCLQYRL